MTDRFGWAALSSDFGRPVPLADESELLHEAGVRIYNGDERTDFDDGTLTVTTHRLLWVEAAGPRRAVQLPLALAHRCDKELPGVRLMSSPRIVVHVLTRPAGSPPGLVAHSPATFVKLSFRRAGGKDRLGAFFVALESSVAQKKWTLTPSPASMTPSRAGSLGVGITGIQRAKAEQLKSGDDTIRAAFQGDLQDLMGKAKEMVALAQRYTARMDSRGAAGPAPEDSAQFQRHLLSLGVVVPVTRSTHGSGSVYHRELARELAAYLAPILQQRQGTMLLQDVYCLYNRARGTELVSPDDLLQATALFESLGLPLRQRTFASKVIVVELTSTGASLDLMALIQRAGHLSASQLAQVRDLSTTLALAYLLAAEEQGQLCRDDTIEGLIFYPNKFLSPRIEIAL